ncbi:MAG TPA: hypothetical protein VF735_07180 [Pyrinomonadaceae bacterium]|jgi:hypothetical protein
MPDDPLTIKGGSLKIESSKKLKENNGTGGKYNYDHPESGRITSVEIDGNTYPATQYSTIVIHYEVP